MNDDTVVNAHFSQDLYELKLNVIGEGEVATSPEKDYYLYGDNVMLQATPASGWRFVEWRGDIDGDTPLIEHSFDGDVDIKAVFEQSLPNPSHYVYCPVTMSNS